MNNHTTICDNAMNRLQDAARKISPLCVGLDTDPSYLPASVLGAYPSPADAVLAYNKAVIERLGDAACCCKVQIAYYEAMGVRGMDAYAQTLRAVRDAGLVVIADIKRGDIADTASAYARAHFSGDFEADIITVNPYMGFDTLAPFVDMAHNGAKGIFVLLRTSNPGMNDIESLALASGGLVLDRVGGEILRLAGEFAESKSADSGQSVCPPVGAVVGCTEENNARELRGAYKNIFFLIPGYGAQGGAAKIAATLLGEAGGVVNSSRGILTAWKKEYANARTNVRSSHTLDEIADAAVRAARAAKNDLLAALSK
jgi:orotidine-5'-phosphate decarboxylase